MARMLVDAAHAEEVRVVVCDNGKIEEFDYQNIDKKSSKGNIYLAKVTRVEPSLQAAFIEFGGQRHGFLPFAEIHPLYYQIPVADKESLLEEMNRSSKPQPEPVENLASDEEGSENAPHSNLGEGESDYDIKDRPQFYRRYRIQEVIKKDQVILVQIEKEERGSKGASFTTYISLAGRYCVHMPNATKGGGVSRKIQDDQDRQRLKKLAAELTNDNDGQGAIIIRTAGAYKTKMEIKRDYQYLLRLWNNIREHTVQSKAPAFIHEEGDVIKRAIRDLYHGEIEEVLVEGKQAYEDAREFMKLILPRHINKIKHYEDKLPLFSRFNVEEKIAELYSNQVRLRSGGYLVINQTEALVAIDVNSGRSTKERNVENTALRTNIEAAHEVAKQLHLRDLSGLIVVDFIDMEDINNRKAVERELKHALSRDKAKVQIGRISNFGLLEMSRQRLNQSLLEANSEVCQHCNGKGRVRHLASTSIVVLRAIEREVAALNSGEVIVSGCLALILNLVNNKREQITALEKKFNGKITFYVDESAGGDGFFIEKKAGSHKKVEEKAPSGIDQAVYIEETPPTPEEEAQEAADLKEIMPKEQRGKNNRNFHSKKIRHKFKHGRDSQHSGRSVEKATNQAIEENDTSNSMDVYYQQKNENELASTNNNRDFSRPGNRKGRFKKFPKKEPGLADNKVSAVREVSQMQDEADEISPKEMAERRKKNQSLLKEIWKKIVD